MKISRILVLGSCMLFFAASVRAQKKYSKKQIEKLKTEAAAIVEANHKQSHFRNSYGMVCEVEQR